MQEYLELEEIISVIVPVYNVEKYLKKCLNSIVNQTYMNLQIILIDDGSKDKSSEICDLFAMQDKRIVVVHRKNGGISKARNSGLDLVQGKYIVFVDSDDYIDNTMIEFLYKGIKENEADYAVCGFATVTDKNEIIKEYKPIGEVLSGKNALKMHYFAEEYQVNYVTPWAKIFKREVWNEIRFVENICFEDIEIMPRILFNCNKVVTINKIGYYYVQHESSVMHNLSLREKMYKDSIDIFEKHILLYQKEGIIELRNEVIQLLLDKIIVSDIHNSIPECLVRESKKLYNKYFMEILIGRVSCKKYVRFWVYRILGKKGYEMLNRLLKYKVA